jgi:dihydroorotase
VEDSDALDIDLSDCIVTSGLIDIHTHLLEFGNSRFGFPADMATIPFGVTYAVDACAINSNVDTLDNLCVETKAFIPVCVKGQSLDYDEMQRRLNLYGERILGVKVYFDQTQSDGISYELFRLANEYAHQKGLRVMVHCAYSETPMADIIDLLESGDVLTHCYHGAYHTIDENDYLAYKKAKQKGVIIDAGMAGGVHTDFEVLKNAITKGYIPDTISSDVTKWSAYTRGGVYGLTACMSIMKTLGMSEEKIFQAVTKNPAHLLSQKSWFCIREGDAATISAIKYDDGKIDITDKAGNRVASDKSYQCKITIKNGQIIYRN